MSHDTSDTEKIADDIINLFQENNALNKGYPRRKVKDKLIEFLKGLLE